MKVRSKIFWPTRIIESSCNWLMSGTFLALKSNEDSSDLPRPEFLNLCFFRVFLLYMSANSGSQGINLPNMKVLMSEVKQISF